MHADTDNTVQVGSVPRGLEQCGTDAQRAKRAGAVWDRCAACQEGWGSVGQVGSMPRGLGQCGTDAQRARKVRSKHSSMP